MPVVNWSTQRTLNEFLTGTQSDVSIATLTTGDLIAVWVDDSTGVSRIMGRKFNSAGQSTYGPEFVIASSSTTAYTQPDVSPNGIGGFIVSYTQTANGGDSDVAVQVFNNGGVPTTAPSVLVQAGNQGYVETAGVNGFIAVYETGTDIKVQLFSNTGVAGASATVNTSPASGSNNYVSTVRLPNGNYVVAWNGADTINYRLYDAALNPVTAQLTTGTTSVGPVVVSNYLTGFALVYETSASGLNGRIQGQIYDNAGNAFDSTPFNVSRPVDANSNFAEVTFIPATGELLVTWVVGNYIYGRTIEPQSGAGGAQFMIDTHGALTGSTTTKNNISITPMNDGRVAVAWTGFSDGDTVPRMQILDPRDGAVGGTNNNDILFGNQLFNDQIQGFAGNDFIYGLGGDDRITPGSGNDVVYGGSGFDTIVVDNMTGESIIRYVRTLHGSFLFEAPDEGVDVWRGVEAVRFGNGEATEITAYSTTNVDGDRDSDIITYSQSTGQVAYTLLQNGFRAGGGVMVDAAATSGDWDVQASGAFTDDVETDLVLKNSATGQFQISLQHGGRQYATANLGVIGTSWDVVTTGDYNRDGVSDLLWRNSANGALYIWTFDDTVHQTASFSIGALGTNWTAGPSLDVDADMDDDILLRDSSNGHLYIYNIENGVQVGGGSLGILGTNWVVQRTGDFDSDLRGDIVLKNTATGQFYIWLMKANLNYVGVDLGVIGTDWNVVGAGDYNGDSTDDILWRNSTTGQLFIWTFEDGQHNQQGDINLGPISSDLVII